MARFGAPNPLNESSWRVPVISPRSEPRNTKLDVKGGLESSIFELVLMLISALGGVRGGLAIAYENV